LAALPDILFGLTLFSDNIQIILLFNGFISIIVSPYLVFFRWNIVVEVDEKEVVFIRGREPYHTFKFSENRFASSVNVDITNFVKTTSRHLRVFTINAEYGKDYKLHNFSKRTFEELMAYIMSFDFKESLQDTVVVLADDEKEDEVMSRGNLLHGVVDELKTTPLEFTINKQYYIKKTRTVIIAMGIPMGVITIPLIIADIIFLTVAFILLPILIIMGVIPYKKAKTAPERITLYHDRIYIDRREYNFNNINRIIMTPPMSTGNMVVRRTLKIIENNQTVIYALGDNSDLFPHRINNPKPKIFEEYDTLYNSLDVIFAMMVGKNEVSKFAPEIK